MFRFIRFGSPNRAVLAAAVLAVAGGLSAVPAQAQYSSEYSPPKLVHQGKTSQPIAGTGTVVVQVQVHSNGSHKAIRVIHSSNAGDNRAAMEIAQNSTYRVAHRGSKAVEAYYDFTLKFKGKFVSTNSGGGVAMSGASAQIDRDIRLGKYAAAKSLATQGLATNPNDAALNQELGTSDYFMSDYSGAAAAFDKVPTVSKEFAQVAAQSYALAAVRASTTDPALGVTYGKKAVAMSPGANSYYALGSAEISAGASAAAVADLKKAHDLEMADPKADTKTKVAIDSGLYQAYTKTNDAASADATLAEIKQLEPNDSSLPVLEGNRYIAAGNEASKAGKHEEAISDFEKAAAAGNPQVSVTANAAAALEENAMIQAQKTAPTTQDYAKVKAFADKALAVNANDALANFAEGVGLAGEYLTGNKQDASLKSGALAALNKAKAEAQAGGNMSLSINIDNFIKQTFK